MLDYGLFFIGIIVLGDIMLIPLLYFAVTNSLSLPSVIFVGILGKIAADSMWYWVGSHFQKGRIYNFLKLDLLHKKSPELFDNFSQKADKILFVSNFLHGIRIPVRIFYGIEQLSFKMFLKINILGSFLWLMIIAGFAYTLDVSAEELKIYVSRGEIVLTTFFIIFIAFEIWAKKFVRRFFKNTKN